ncbi:SUMF1/EgtB/PvdO family nonheme iron enzyme [Rahnella perminowiae]|uniref:formylglycine-generating enzyme family protein n=1 Tax=Rahnella perminowiae TaxID=2816244 RepID=UPI00224AF172|nr:SUMF1/EgtB/PvdO family nonheme iron enzyme [Rahnella perminowiae]MCX2942101.1 SUMF1/EgtB/PvdO family nonheme iron enzyme [Rahnella perminowiae]
MKITSCLIVLAPLFLVNSCDNVKSAPQGARTPQEKVEIQNFITKVKSEMIFVHGGKFWMGDFCSKSRNTTADCTSDEDNKPLHEVELASYSISKFKFTHEYYDFYLKIKNLPEQKFKSKSIDDIFVQMIHFKNSPAIVTWTEADNFCTWLKIETGLPFSLPTEAQWEYAARNRGQYLLLGTDDGTWRINKKTELGENIPSEEDRRKVEEDDGVMSSLVHFPVDKYPANGLGLYDMAANGFEWAKDWYDPNYYKNSPSKDPQGPDNPVVKDNQTGQYLKSLRSINFSTSGIPEGLTFSRSRKIKDADYPAGTTARCVINSATPIRNQ